MSEGAPGVAVPSIGVVHFCLRVPHVDRADYRWQQRLLVAPFARRLAWRSFAVGVSIGALITFPLVIAAFYWNFWADVTLEFGLGRLIRPVVIDGAATWLGVAAVFFAGYVAARIDGVVLYKSVLRTMYASSR